MPSSIPGFEYDIFISYRQKDNAYDGWVTAFIANLRKELESTFKEQIYIYSDENPGDGIQEIHHVKESLLTKLKCVVFIPIVSQTYCDPNCYAWKNEFQVFKEQALSDSIGLKITLSNGNVVSRIVPVRIHDLDPQDQAILEQELGKPLRSIDFVFKSAGVNRPLRENEDHPADNQYKLYYRDQINKVANIIKELVLSLKNDNYQKSISTDFSDNASQTKLSNDPWKKIIIAIVAILLSLIAYYIFFNKDRFLSGQDKRIAIAVLPFTSIGPEEESQYFADGVMEVLLSNLTLFSELKVKPKATVERYRGMSGSIPEIATSLDVDYVLYGSAQKYGDDIRVVVQLVDANTDENIWSQNFVKKLSNLFEIQNQISEEVASYLKANLTAKISKQISQTPTDNFEAYDLYLRARQLSRKFERSRDSNDINQAIRLLERSIEIDNNFALGFAWLAGLKAIRSPESIENKLIRDSIAHLANESLGIDSTIVEANLVLSQIYNYELDNVNTLRYSYKALGSSTIDSLTATQLLNRIAAVYSRIGDSDKAVYLYDLLYSLNQNNTDALYLKFIPLAANHDLKELKILADQIRHLDPEDIFADIVMAHVMVEKKDFLGLEKIYHEIKRKDKTMTFEKLDQYSFMFAKALKMNGNTIEANSWISKLEEQVANDDLYSRSQLMILSGNSQNALDLLEEVSIGWYNVNLCLINPVFDDVSDDLRFKNFIKSNTNQISNQRERINELERNGYLPQPNLFFGGKNSGNENWM